MEADTGNDGLLQYNNISLAGKVAGLKGTMKINKNGLAWKSTAGKSIVTKGADILKAEWINVARMNQLRLTLRGGAQFAFDGFREQDFDHLKAFFKDNFQVDLPTRELATTGWNWGKMQFEDKTLKFQSDLRDAFTIPMNDVSQSILHNKNEVSLEFHQDDTTNSLESDTLVEIRFFIPQDKDKDQVKDQVKDSETTASHYHKMFLEKADIDAGSGGGLVLFRNVAVLTPRGRYDVDVYPNFVKLHGRTYDYKIAFTSVHHLFELPKPDNRNICFVISLDPPIRQGHTRYPNIVFQFTKEEKMEVDVNLKDYEKKLAEGQKLEPKLKGSTYKLVRRVFRMLTGRKVTVPGKFQSAGQTSAVKCSLKATNGYLYPLEKSFIFIHKPAEYIPFSDIAAIEFARVSSSATAASNRTFDVNVVMKSGGNYQFTSIQRQEFTNLYHFVQEKKLPLKVSNVSGEGEADYSAPVAKIDAGGDGSSDEEDDDFVAPANEEHPDEEYDEMDAEPLALELDKKKPTKKKTEEKSKKKAEDEDVDVEEPPKKRTKRNAASAAEVAIAKEQAGKKGEKGKSVDDDESD